MAKKYYVVFRGRETGIFYDWKKVKPLVNGYSNAVYQGFNDLELANAAFDEYFNPFKVIYT
jgi:ribonuclease HI